MHIIGSVLSRIESWWAHQTGSDDSSEESHNEGECRPSLNEPSAASSRGDHSATGPEAEEENGLPILSHMGHLLGLVVGAFIGAILLLLVLLGYPREKLMEIARRMKSYGLDRDEN